MNQDLEMSKDFISLYTKFRKENGWTEATKTEYEERKVGQTIELWKKVAVFEIPQE